MRSGAASGRFAPGRKQMVVARQVCVLFKRAQRRLRTGNNSRIMWSSWYEIRALTPLERDNMWQSWYREGVALCNVPCAHD